MENDTIRSSGGNTLVDLWVEGKTRGICVSRGAIEAHLQASGLSDEDCCDFVRNHLALLTTAAKIRLAETGTAASTIVIDQLGSAGGNRRKAERRKSDRRKSDRAQEIPAAGDRRRGQRRKGERRDARKKREET